jgi:GH24 family phage-related lysozyme (muramidase)
MHIKLNKFDMKQYRLIELIRDKGRIEDAQNAADRWIKQADHNKIDLEARRQAVVALGLQI